MRVKITGIGKNNRDFLGKLLVSRGFHNPGDGDFIDGIAMNTSVKSYYFAWNPHSTIDDIFKEISISKFTEILMAASNV